MSFDPYDPVNDRLSVSDIALLAGVDIATLHALSTPTHGGSYTLSLPRYLLRRIAESVRQHDPYRRHNFAYVVDQIRAKQQQQDP